MKMNLFILCYLLMITSCSGQQTESDVLLADQHTQQSIATSPEIGTDQYKLDLLVSLIYSNSSSIANENLEKIANNWSPDFIPPLVDLLYLSSDPVLLRNISTLLQSTTGQEKTMDYYEWLHWLWDQDELYGAYYGAFKSALYKHIDPKFDPYFKGRQATANIRLDEIVWGGVQQDGIPPLRHPDSVSYTHLTLPTILLV